MRDNELSNAISEIKSKNWSEISKDEILRLLRDSEGIWKKAKFLVGEKVAITVNYTFGSKCISRGSIGNITQRYIYDHGEFVYYVEFDGDLGVQYSIREDKLKKESEPEELKKFEIAKFEIGDDVRLSRDYLYCSKLIKGNTIGKIVGRHHGEVFSYDIDFDNAFYTVIGIDENLLIGNKAEKQTRESIKYMLEKDEMMKLLAEASEKLSDVSGCKARIDEFLKR